MKNDSELTTLTSLTVFESDLKDLATANSLMGGCGILEHIIKLVCDRSDFDSEDYLNLTTIKER